MINPEPLDKGTLKNELQSILDINSILTKNDESLSNFKLSSLSHVNEMEPLNGCQKNLDELLADDGPHTY